MSKPAKRANPRTSVAAAGVADWFRPNQVPVTLAVGAIGSSALEHLASRLRETTEAGSPVTLCPRAEPADAQCDELSASLATTGIDRSCFRIVKRGAILPEVIPRSPLLAPEYACYPWSERQLMCPAETAWIPMQLSLLPFASDFARLGTVLDQLVDSAEALHDQIYWPTAAMRRDAHLNRRVAIELLDVARYAVGRSASEMHRCIGWISARLQARSSYWAKRREPLPAIHAENPCRRMMPSPLREQWRRRWRAAVLTSAVRHRNLLVMSPWSIVDDTAPERFELLSLLVHADAICLATPDSQLASGVTQRRGFEHKLQVALQQRHALDQIAKHV